MSKKLHHFQKNFMQMIRFGYSDHNEEQKKLMNDICSIGSLTPLKVISVYTEDYYVRLRDVLIDQYIAVNYIMNDKERFWLLADEYIRNYPSKVKDLLFFGNDFPNFLDSETKICTELKKDFPYINELAKFELNYQNLFHAPKVSTTEVINFYESINYLEIEKLTFTFNPQKLFLMHSEFPIIKIWEEANIDSEWEKTSCTNEIDVEKKNIKRTYDKLLDVKEKTNYLIFKKESESFLLKLSPIQYQILALMEDGHSLGIAIEEVAERAPLEEFEISDLFIKLKSNIVPLNTRPLLN